MRDWVWVSVNALIAAAFLWVTSREWIEPELRDIPGVSGSGGGPLVFGLWVIWLLVPLFIVNVIWLVVSIRLAKHRGDVTRPFWLFGLMAACWLFLAHFSASQI